MRDAGCDVLSFAPTDAGGFLTHSQSFRACAPLRAPASSCLSSRSRGLLFPGNGLGRAFTGARVGMGALAANRKPLAVAQAAVAAEIHQPLDVQLNFAPQITLDHVVAVDDFADLERLRVGELRYPPLGRQINLAHDIL